MDSARKEFTHAGSGVAQFKKARVPAERRPAGSKNKLDFDNHTMNETINLGTRLKILSLNVEGISMEKCDYLAKLLQKHDIDILLLQETHLEPKSPPHDHISLALQKSTRNTILNMVLVSMQRSQN